MFPEYEYIYFEAQTSTGKTGRWFCKNKKSEAILGTVSWSGAWRQYCFYPFQNTVFSKGCLHDIQDFLTIVTDCHRTSKKINGIDIIVDNKVPDNELYLASNGKCVGKIVNIGK